jgi:hypothetical protein
MLEKFIVLLARIAIGTLIALALSSLVTSFLAWSLYNATCITNVQLASGQHFDPYEEGQLEQAGHPSPANRKTSR